MVAGRVVLASKPPRLCTFLFELFHLDSTHQGAQSSSPGPHERSKEHCMHAPNPSPPSQQADTDEDAKTSQQQDDTRAQSDLTAKIGTKLSSPEKSTTSSWSAVKRLLRIG
jgi:hypothetical protein